MILPIYTKKGDKGTTKLPFDRRKRSKASCRVKALGEIDELNSLVGVMIAFTKTKKIRELLLQVQHDLFRVQMDLASKGEMFALKNLIPISEVNVAWLEKHIDEMTKKLTPLSKFILPGGSQAGALAQFARAVCRRAEREIADLKRTEKVNSALVQYMNRLSDFLFMLARMLNREANVTEMHPNYYEEGKLA